MEFNIINNFLSFISIYSFQKHDTIWCFNFTFHNQDRII